MTIVMVTHERPLAERFADRLATMGDGKLLSASDSSTEAAPMKPRDLTDLALRNLREAILRNALTTLGVAVGVASLVAMLSLGVGFQELASQTPFAKRPVRHYFRHAKKQLSRHGAPAARTPSPTSLLAFWTKTRARKSRSFPMSSRSIHRCASSPKCASTTNRSPPWLPACRTLRAILARSTA